MHFSYAVWVFSVVTARASFPPQDTELAFAAGIADIRGTRRCTVPQSGRQGARAGGDRKVGGAISVGIAVN